MKRNYYIMWIVLPAIVLLTVLSVIGAFYGAERAKLIFNSVPLVFYWCGLIVLFVTGFSEYSCLLRKPGLFLIHSGCLLILGGSMWGSETGHQFAERFFGIKKIPASGYMLINEGDSEEYIITKDLKYRLGKLPFGLELKDFRVDYYQIGEDSNPMLYVRTREGQKFQLAAEPGAKYSLGEGKGTIKIENVFRNFKIRIEDGKKIITDNEKDEVNPAVEVRIESADGKSYTRYVFERFADFSHNEHEKLQLRYVSEKPRMVKDYFSDVVIIKDGEEVLNKTIEVNHPLRYGGYHFYQHSYDSKAGRYTILLVASDSGLYMVYSGYWMLGIGVFWQFWFRSIVEYIKKRIKA